MLEAIASVLFVDDATREQGFVDREEVPAILELAVPERHDLRQEVGLVGADANGAQGSESFSGLSSMATRSRAGWKSESLTSAAW